MNVLTYFSKQKVTARLFAVLTIVSLLLSAFPAAFFVAEAATNVDFQVFALPDPTGDDSLGEFVTLSNLSSQSVDMTGWKLVDNNGDETLLDGLGIIAGPSDSQICANTDFSTNGGVVCALAFDASFNLVNSDGKVDLVAPDGQVEVNLTWTSVSEGQFVNTTGSLDDVLGTTGGDKIDICHATESDSNPYNAQSPNLNSFFGGHDEDTKDIIPPFFYDQGEGAKFFSGNNWTPENEEFLEAGCSDQDVIDICPNLKGDQSELPEGFEFDDEQNCVPEEPEEPEYGPYCGDDEINQEWEQCDGTDVADGKICTDQCQFVTKDPVCTDLTLARVDIEDFENKDGGAGDMTDDIYLGGNTPIPNGAWFLVNWNGSDVIDPDISGYEDVPGLAVERSAGKIRSVMHGSQTNADEEFVTGEVEFWSWDDSVEATSVSSDDSDGLGKSNKLEGDYTDGSGLGKTNAGDDEIWVDDGVGNFWLTTTSADDGFYVEYSEPAVCEQPAACEAGVNLIENPGFELPVVASWSVFYTGEASLAWLTGKNGIEIQNNVAGSPHSGNQHAELDPHNPTMIWQDIPTVPGETYQFSTYYSPRPGRDAADNAFEFVVDGSALGSEISRTGVGNNDTVWTLEEREFVATGAVTSVGFRETGADTSFGAYIDDVSLVCVPEKEPDTATVYTSKIVCTDEQDLPNWGAGGPTIDENTALDWVDEHDSCELVKDWEFEWAPHGTSDPGDTLIGSAGGDWTTFTGSAEVPESVIKDGKFWMREVLKEGFIPFTHGPSGNNNSNDVSAEFYCNTDVLNYDNYDRIDNPVADGEYYCVAWNVPDVPDYGPYCGDGEINQEWEQCDGDDVEGGETCTDYCTLDNQCTDLRLMKITLDSTDSTSFDGTLHLGSAGNVIPNGTWFNFDEDGDDTYTAIANAIDGLAIERDTDNNKLALAFVGGNGSRQLDIVQGSIMTLGIDLGAVDRNPNPQFKLEDGGGSSFYDIFEKDGDEGVDFDLRADTGNDGVTVAVGVGEEYNCDDCMAEVEARVVLQDGEEIFNGGEGNLLPQVILGDGSVVEFGEWFKLSEAPALGESAEWIDDDETVTNFTDPETLDGLFVSREGNGTVKVALYGYHNPGGDTNYESLRATIEFNDAKVLSGTTAEIPGNYQLENHSEADNVNSNDNFDSLDEADDLMSVDFDLWVDTKADGFTVTLDETEVAVCDGDSDPEEDFYLIDGYKFVQEYDYVYGDADWTIELYDEGGLVMSTTTDDDGYYYFWVPEGDYEVREVIPEGWMQIGVQDGGEYEDTEGQLEYCSVELPYEEEKELPVFNSISLILDNVERNYSDYRCDFYNKETPLHLIDGYKYQVTFDAPTTVEGWSIYATNGSTTLSTTTDADGYYWFEVPAGDWEVYEGDREGWILVDVEQLGDRYLLFDEYDEYEDQDITSCDFRMVNYGEYPYAVAVQEETFSSYDQFEGYRCNFYNEELSDDDDDDDGDNSTGTRIGRGGPAPLVLGESTSQCEFLEEYMQMGVENNSWEVTKLQMFLKIVMGYDNPVDGFFGPETDLNVKRFQEQYRGEILDPWYLRGIVPHYEPTGFVYKLTKWKVNDIVCPGWDPYPSFEGEDLNSNIDLD